MTKKREPTPQELLRRKLQPLKPKPKKASTKGETVRTPWWVRLLWHKVKHPSHHVRLDHWRCCGFCGFMGR